MKALAMEKNLTLSVYGAVDYQYITGGQPYVSVWDDYLPISLDHYYNLIVFFDISDSSLLLYLLSFSIIFPPVLYHAPHQV